jgi:hypothetical protein
MGSCRMQCVYEEGAVTTFESFTNRLKLHLKFSDILYTPTPVAIEQAVTVCGYSITTTQICKICQQRAIVSNCGTHYTPTNRRNLKTIRNMKIIDLKTINDPWENGRIYHRNDKVVYSNQNYICTGTTIEVPGSSDVQWKIMPDEYIHGHVYSRNDKVTYDGVILISTIDNNKSIPNPKTSYAWSTNQIVEVEEKHSEEPVVVEEHVQEPVVVEEPVIEEPVIEEPVQEPVQYQEPPIKRQRTTPQEAVPDDDELDSLLRDSHDVIDQVVIECPRCGLSNHRTDPLRCRGCRFVWTPS